MFTGLVEEVGEVRAVAPGALSSRITVAAARVLEGTVEGDSVCISGTCLTVTGIEPGALSFTAVHETLSRSTLGKLRAGSKVNLERALAVGSRLGGHFVQGHVDGTTRLQGITPEGESRRFTFHLPSELSRYLVEKGSIAIDGISLTVASLSSDRFSVALIPHTLGATTLDFLRPGDEVNLEVDLLAKYVERLLGAPTEGVTEDFLRRYGFA
jgi:riboflavin synthase